MFKISRCSSILNAPEEWGILIVVDCEAPFGVGAPSVRDMTEFGAVDVNALRGGPRGRRFTMWTPPYDHHPVHDALGNAEALIRRFDGER